MILFFVFTPWGSTVSNKLIHIQQERFRLNTTLFKTNKKLSNASWGWDSVVKFWNSMGTHPKRSWACFILK